MRSAAFSATRASGEKPAMPPARLILVCPSLLPTPPLPAVVPLVTRVTFPPTMFGSSSVVTVSAVALSRPDPTAYSSSSSVQTLILPTMVSCSSSLSSYSNAALYVLP